MIQFIKGLIKFYHLDLFLSNFIARTEFEGSLNILLVISVLVSGGQKVLDLEQSK